jgi:hypothetical protein
MTYAGPWLVVEMRDNPLPGIEGQPTVCYHQATNQAKPGFQQL